MNVLSWSWTMQKVSNGAKESGRGANMLRRSGPRMRIGRRAESWVLGNPFLGCLRLTGGCCGHYCNVKLGVHVA